MTYIPLIAWHFICMYGDQVTWLSYGSHITITPQVLLPPTDALPDGQGLGGETEADWWEKDGGQRSHSPAVCFHRHRELRAGDATAVTGGQGWLACRGAGSVHAVSFKIRPRFNNRTWLVNLFQLAGFPWPQARVLIYTLILQESVPQGVTEDKKRTMTFRFSMFHNGKT